MHDLDLAVAAGTRVAVLGPNGAGKSTLLRMAAGLLRPDGGDIRVDGHAMPDGAAAVRGALGYLGHQPMVYLDLTAWHNLELFADLYGVPRARIGDLLDRVGLLPRAYDVVRTFSRGMTQRLGMARLMLHEPRLLVLDEPHVGLDAPGAALLDGLLGDAAAGRTVLMATHEVERAAAVCDRAVVLRGGRLALDVPLAGLDGPALRARYEEAVA